MLVTLSINCHITKADVLQKRDRGLAIELDFRNSMVEILKVYLNKVKVGVLVLYKKVAVSFRE